MTRLDEAITVGQLVVERPARSRVFERLGIDYCCGGKKPLAAACAEKGLAADEVIRELEAADAAPSAELVDAAGMSLTHLADHIEQTHHAWLKREVPRLAAIAEKVARVHGPRHPALIEVRDT